MPLSTMENDYHNPYDHDGGGGGRSGQLFVYFQLFVHFQLIVYFYHNLQRGERPPEPLRAGAPRHLHAGQDALGIALHPLR